MLDSLASLSPTHMVLVAGVLTAMYAWVYATYVLRVPRHEANKTFFKTLAAGLAAAGTLALLVRAAPAPQAPLTAEPFFAPLV